MKHKQKQRKPLKRGKPLKRTGELKRTGKLKPRSNKTRQKYEERNKLREAASAEQRMCDACELLHNFTEGDAGSLFPREAVDIHEKLTRARGGSITDKDNLAYLCRPCHTFITEHTTAGEEVGMVDPSHGKHLSPYDRIMSRVRLVPTTGCLEYTGYTNRAGYAWVSRKRSDGKHRPGLGHRIVYEHVNGPIPDGMLIRHKCDNPPCVNPDHLEPGTHLDNHRDARERGRLAEPKRGENSPRAKLSDDQWREIISKRIAGATTVDLAREYGVSPSYVSRVCSGDRKTWAGDLGRSKMPKGSEWIHDSMTSEIVEMRKAGMLTTEIAAVAGKNPGTVWRILKRAAPDLVGGADK